MTKPCLWYTYIQLMRRPTYTQTYERGLLLCVWIWCFFSLFFFWFPASRLWLRVDLFKRRNATVTDLAKLFAFARRCCILRERNWSQKPMQPEVRVNRHHRLVHKVWWQIIRGVCCWCYLWLEILTASGYFFIKCIHVHSINIRFYTRSIDFFYFEIIIIRNKIWRLKQWTWRTS